MGGTLRLAVTGFHARCALFALLLVAALARAGEGERATLAAHGLSPDTASLSGYLRPLCPTESERQVAAELVAELASDSPSRRHHAVQWLGTRSGPPLVALGEAAASADPDVRRIGEQLLREALDRVQRGVLRAVLRTAADERVTGLAEDLLGIAHLASFLQLDTEVARALRGTLTEADLPLLRETAAGGEVHARAAAIRALGAAAGAGPDEVAAYAGSKVELLRLSAALAFADRGDRRCLPLLGSLLDAEDALVRRDAADALRVVHGPGTGYDPFAAAEVRRAAAAAWRERIADEGDETPWEPPLPITRRYLGRTLVAVWREGRLVEFDAEGRTTFEVTGLPYPWAVQGLPDGRRLVILYQARTLIEYGATGEELTRLPLPDGVPGGFDRLENGHTLIAMMNPNRVVEIDDRGELVNQWEVRGAPVDVQHLESGHMLVCVRQGGTVIELDRDGHIRWSLAGKTNPMCARRLPNGNTLVAELNPRGGRAVEYDRDGRVVWEKATLSYCYSVQRMPDGTIVAADLSGVREFGTDGSEHWILRVDQGPVRACRY